MSLSSSFNLQSQYLGVVVVSQKGEANFTFVVFPRRIKEFNEWAQCLILELAVKYVPSDSNDIFDIMNLLEDRLQHANGAVVLATVKVFLQLTLSMTDVHQQVQSLPPFSSIMEKGS